MTKKKVLITDRFDQDSYLLLKSQPHLEVERSQDPWQIPDNLLRQTHALIIRSRTTITEDLLKKAPHLEVIITCTSGFDHIDLGATAKWGITVMYTPEANQESAAQLTWSLILAGAQRLRPAMQQVLSGEWHRERIVGMELAGRQLGVVGLGRIGTRVAKIGQAFGMKVQAYDPYQEESHFAELSIPRLSYEELLKSSDVLTFHVPKTRETQYMLNRSHFEYIQRGILLINTSRGSVIKELDLCDALDHGWIRFVGLDVFEKEPLSPQGRMLSRKAEGAVSWPQEVLFTPHIGANTDEAFYKASQMASEKLLRFFSDSSATDILPPKADWYLY